MYAADLLAGTPISRISLPSKEEMHPAPMKMFDSQPIGAAIFAWLA